MNLRRTKVLMVKEMHQLLRDRLSLSIGIMLPISLLLLFGYAMSMDIRNIRLAVVIPKTSPETTEMMARFQASKYFSIVRTVSPHEADVLIHNHKVDAILYLPADMNKKAVSGDLSVMIVVNAVNAIQSRTMGNYIKAVVTGVFEKNSAASKGGIQLLPRMWFNEANDSRYYMVPGVIVIIMTTIGALLTSLVMAREYERGNLESIFVSPVKPMEILAAKAMNNFLLGTIGLLISLSAAHWLFGVPIRGSVAILIFGSLIYLLVALGIGLVISSITKNQFMASQMTLVLTFMPAIVLSGFIYEINNMPFAIQCITSIIPARYYVEFLQTMFLAGHVWSIIIKDIAILSLFATLLLLLAKIKNPKSLES